MDLIKVQMQSGTIAFGINHFKIVYGNNSDKKYEMFRTIQHCLLKEDESEYEEESNSKCSITLNDNRTDSRMIKCIRFNIFDSIDNIIEISSKSLMTEYIESMLKDIEFLDSFATLNQTLLAMNSDVLDEITITQDNHQIIFQVKEFVLKSFIKLIEASILIDEQNAHDFDVSVEYKMSLFLNLVSSLAKENQIKKYICILDVIELKQNLYLELQQLNQDNLYILVNVEHISTNINPEFILILDKETIDLGIDEQVYESLVIENDVGYDLETIKSKIQNHFTNSFHKPSIIDQLIINIR